MLTLSLFTSTVTMLMPWQRTLVTSHYSSRWLTSGCSIRYTCSECYTSQISLSLQLVIHKKNLYIHNVHDYSNNPANPIIEFTIWLDFPSIVGGSWSVGGAHIQRHLCHVVLWSAQEASLQLAGLGRQPGEEEYARKCRELHFTCKRVQKEL